MAPCTSPLLFLLLVAAVAPAAAASLRFEPPVYLGDVHWGVTFFASVDYDHVFVQTSEPVETTDGGKTFTKATAQGVDIRSNLASPTAVGAQPRTLHDYGTISVNKPPGTTWTSFHSNTSSLYELNSGRIEVTTVNKSVSFSGLHPGISCDHFACPIRLQGSGFVALKDGSMVQSAIVYWGGNPKSPPATSVVAFRSTDGYNWQFLSVIANASAYTWSEEGPNEHDLALLDDGSILAVVRMDGGDGVETHPYRNYYRTTSSDGGKTWSTLEEIPNAGCARPRLLKMPSALFLSGGRAKNVGTDSPLLWISTDGQGAKWEEYDISYHHNQGEMDPEKQFTAAVNTTANPRETTAYTSLVQVGPNSALVMYDLMREKNNYGFAMRVTIEEE